jgi:hypothetical protein
MPVVEQEAARNMHKGPLVLASDQKGTHSVEWAGNGDPNGEDVQFVPEEVAKCPAYARAIRRGLLRRVEIDDEGVVQALDRQQEAWQARTAEGDRKAMETIDRQQNNDMIAVRCVGPDSRGAGQCPTEVTVREKSKNDTPPLCAKHVALAPEYVPTQDTTGETPVTKWLRATLGPRETEQ